MAQEISAAPSLRFAFVTGGLDLGGTTTFMCNFAGELTQRNIPAAVYSLTQDHPLASDFRARNIPVHREDERRYIFEDRMASLLGRLAEFKPTLVVANVAPDSFEVLRYLPSGVCRVGMVQSDDPDWYAMLRHYSQHLDLVVAVSETIKARIRALPEFMAARVCYLPYGVPMPDELNSNEPESNHPLRILYLGRLEQIQKRVRLFPVILQQLKESGIPFHWTIAGDGPERAALEQQMKDTAPDQRVSFVGKVAYADVPKLLANHNVFLLASDYEGLPLSLLEAAGHGLVPVVSDLPSGIREIVDETSGIRVAPENTTGYASAIVQLHQQRDRLKALSRGARAKVQREFSVTAMTDRWLATIAVQTPATPPAWPREFKIQPILGAANSWWFAAPTRIVRRALVKWRR